VDQQDLPQGKVVAAMKPSDVLRAYQRGMRDAGLMVEENMLIHVDELAAALGWPGGVTEPIRDKTKLLQMVAELHRRSV
jgi:hypothetical protein